MTPPTRRKFIKQATAAGAASLLAPSLVRASTPTSSVVHNQPLRETLTGNWEFLRMPLAGPWEAWSDQPLAAWTSVSLPHCYNSYDACDPDVPAYRGKGWYRRLLSIDNPFPNGRTMLHFEGAGQSSEIYMDNTLAARHIGGYDEFVVDITGLVGKTCSGAEACIRLSILCDNSPEMKRMPADLSDFTLYGGLYRKVHLLYAPSISLKRVHVRVQVGKDTPAFVQVEGRLYNPGQALSKVQVDVTVRDPAGVEVHHESLELTAWNNTASLTSFELPRPLLWSPANPNLYYCTVTLTSPEGVCQQVERFGVRFFEFQEKGPFLLNGERLLIRGTHRHEDHAGYASAMPDSQIRREMVLIKEMGANFLRLAHYQQSQLVLDLCDELGIMVWEEVPWCRAGVGDELFQQQGREKLSSMIDQHFNHPSVICWGLGNEDDWHGEYPALDESGIRTYMSELNALAHKLDNTRVTSYRRADFARDVPDVYSPSIWAGWYGGRYVDYQQALTESRDRNRRMLHVEWGADSHARRHAEDPYKTLTGVKDGDTAERGLAYLSKGGTARASKDGDWSETYACDLFDWHLKVQQSLPWLSGAVQWIFKDFSTPLRPENPVPRINQKGLVERDLTKKESFFVFQSYWAEKPMVHIYGHSWPVRWGTPGQLRRVRLYSNCPSVELFVNGSSLGVRRRDIQDFPCAGLRWDTAFAAGRNKLRAVATTKAGEEVIDEIEFFYQTEPWKEPATMRLQLIQRTTTTALVEATLMDDKGRLCLDARNVVRFSIAGNGSLLDNQGTSTGSRVVQLYNGRAQIGVCIKQESATVSVISNGVSAAFLSL